MADAIPMECEVLGLSIDDVGLIVSQHIRMTTVVE